MRYLGGSNDSINVNNSLKVFHFLIIKQIRKLCTVEEKRVRLELGQSDAITRVTL